MRVRILRFQTRNPVLGAIVLVLVLALLAAVFAVGLTLLAGLAVAGAVVGGGALLARRALGGRRTTTTLPPPLDRAREVFPPGHDPSDERDARDAPGRRLPPGAP